MNRFLIILRKQTSSRNITNINNTCTVNIPVKKMSVLGLTDKICNEFSGYRFKWSRLFVKSRPLISHSEAFFFKNTCFPKNERQGD